MTIRRPRVSIGLPVYNGAEFVAEALNSLLAQTYRDFELIISDNGSTDETEAICRAYALKDSRIQYHRNGENRGAAWNFNYVFELSTGDYFKWVAHDDICAREFLERCVDVLDQMPFVILCYAKTKIIDEQGRHVASYIERCDVSFPRPSERFRNLLRNLGLSNPMFGVARANILRMTPLIGHYIASDVILMAELALRGQFYEVPEWLFFRRDHPGKSTRANRTGGEKASWYDPANTGKLEWRTWRHFFGLLECIRRVEMPRYEKAACYVYMAKWFRWNLRGMAEELRGAEAVLVRRLVGRRPFMGDA